MCKFMNFLEGDNHVPSFDGSMDSALIPPKVQF